ncbi:sel1 repeat family protein [Pigmentiphaga aceris]|uniref:Sel1 repeat family protein n=1 Tax=Pigmentiphaga aceris TaxID=1940612 RepID=A0A5C0B161_9BURK|nr:tetratricopeptide repeat protein [Pigmentiphaga aceris]QEI08332.1 sel1 repeat family protein [Pigmentiphaga aceris]
MATSVVGRWLNTWADRVFERMMRKPLPGKPWDHLYQLGAQTLQQRAEGGDAKAAYVLGDMYDQGSYGVRKNLNAAIKWYRLAAEQEDGDALNNLGSMHQHGDGLPQDMEQARMYFERAAAAGCGVAMNNLGHFHNHGRGGLVADPAAAVKWFKAGACRHDGNALVSLGYAYSKGTGVRKSPLRAIYWYRRAALAGDHKGAYNLAVGYWYGVDLMEDHRKAIGLLRASSVYDHAGTNFLLGRAQFEGLGMTKDLGEGLRLLRRAADAGYEQAHDYLQQTRYATPTRTVPGAKPNTQT